MAYFSMRLRFLLFDEVINLFWRAHHHNLLTILIFFKRLINSFPYFIHSTINDILFDFDLIQKWNRLLAFAFALLLRRLEFWERQMILVWRCCERFSSNNWKLIKNHIILFLVHFLVLAWKLISWVFFWIEVDLGVMEKMWI